MNKQRPVFHRALSIILAVAVVGMVAPFAAAPETERAFAQMPDGPTPPASPALQRQIFLPVSLHNAWGFPPIIPATTNVLTGQQLVATSPNGELSFAAMTPQLAAVAPGEVVVAEPSPAAPYGYLRRVTAVNATANSVILSTQPATLEDAIEQGAFWVEKTLRPSDVTDQVLAPGVALRAVNPAEPSDGFFIEVEDFPVYDEDGNPNTASDQILISGSVDILPSFEFSLQIHDWTIRELAFTSNVQETTELEVEARVELYSLDSEKELAQFTLAAITVFVGPVPIVLTPVLKVVAGTDGSVYVGVTASVTQEATLTSGLRYYDGAWTPIADFDTSFQFELPRPTLGVDLKAYTAGRVSLMLYGTADPGPYLGVQLFLDLEGDIFAEPLWMLYGGIEVVVGVNPEILGFSIAQYEATVIGYRTTLAQAPPGASGSGAVQVSAGGAHVCARMPSGGLKCWGNNYGGQLGDGTNDNRTAPVEVSGLSSATSMVTTGGAHSCVVTASTGLKCWGGNNYGELGDGTNRNRNTPVNVLGLSTGVLAVDGGEAHTCAVTTAGGVKCWGANWSGQLGDGTTNDRNRPVDVVGLASGVVAVAGGGNHTCALMASGGLKCWGVNSSGQLGDGTTVRRLTPVSVVGLAGSVSAVVTGRDFSCARLSDGRVQCWGKNEFGQLGDGSTTNRTRPVSVVGLSEDAESLSAGHFHACVATQSGAAKCWGSNHEHQLGANVYFYSPTPVGVTGLTSGIAEVAIGDDYSCARSTRGGLKCWGQNYSGQLGDGTTTMRPAPINVIGFGG